MKQKDIALIAIVAIFAAVVSILLSNFLFGGDKNLQTTVEKVEKISADFPDPDPRYFNPDSENPTQLIKIRTNDNQAPFGAAAQ